MARSITFSGFDLQAAPYSIISTDAFSSPEREIIFQELARADNAVAVFRRYRSRTITVGGMISDSTSDLLDADIDTLKLKVMQAGKGTLAVGWAAATRNWGAECKNMIISRANTDVSRAAFSAEFFCENAFCTDGVTGTLLSTTVTDANPFSVVSNGTFISSPFITLTINSIGTATAVDIIIGNPTSSEYITVPSRTYVAGDTVTIDCDNKQIFHNSTLVAGEGYFPNWAPGNGSLEYSDTASARNISLVTTYETRYL